MDTLTAAEMAEKAGDPAGAEAAYRQVLAEVPFEPNATAGLAHVLQQQNKLAEAEQVLTAGLKSHPNDPRLLAQLADVDAAEDKPGEAVTLLEQARAADPALAKEDSVTRLLARLKGLSGDNAGAAEIYAALVVADPQDPSLLDALGSAYVRLARYGDAESALSKAVNQRAAFHDDAAWGEAAGHLAFAASKNNDPQMTLQALAERATVLPNSPVTLFLEATAHDTLASDQGSGEGLHRVSCCSRGEVSRPGVSGSSPPDRSEEHEVARHGSTREVRYGQAGLYETDVWLLWQGGGGGSAGGSVGRDCASRRTGGRHGGRDDTGADGAAGGYRGSSGSMLSLYRSCSGADQPGGKRDGSRGRGSGHRDHDPRR